MAESTRSILKTYFETGDYPTQAQFAELIDSLWSLKDNGYPSIMYAGATDADLDSPEDTTDTLSHELLFTDDNGPILQVGTYQWIANQSFLGQTPVFVGQSIGNSYGEIKFYPQSGNWSNFASGSQNGLKTFEFDGQGSFKYFYHYEAWVTAFGGGNNGIMIAKNGDVYKDNIQAANLVVDHKGRVGNAGKLGFRQFPVYLGIMASDLTTSTDLYKSINGMVFKYFGADIVIKSIRMAMKFADSGASPGSVHLKKNGVDTILNTNAPSSNGIYTMDYTIYSKIIISNGDYIAVDFTQGTAGDAANLLIVITVEFI